MFLFSYKKMCVLREGQFASRIWWWFLVIGKPQIIALRNTIRMFPPKAMVEWVLVMFHHFLLFYERTMSYQKFMRFKASPQALLNWLEIKVAMEFPESWFICFVCFFIRYLLVGRIVGVQYLGILPHFWAWHW